MMVHIYLLTKNQMQLSYIVVLSRDLLMKLVFSYSSCLLNNSAQRALTKILRLEVFKQCPSKLQSTIICVNHTFYDTYSYVLCEIALTLSCTLDFFSH